MQTTNRQQAHTVHSLTKARKFVYINNVGSDISKRLNVANKTSFGLMQHLRTVIISRNIERTLYKTLIRPELAHGSEAWTERQSNEQLLGGFERRVLRHVYKGIIESGVCRWRHKAELHRLCGHPDIVRFIKIDRLRWIRHIQRMQQIVHRTLMGNIPGDRLRVI